MSDEYKTWNSSQPADEDQDSSSSTRRIIAIAVASVLVFSLIAGAVGFVVKRQYDLKQEELRKAKEAAESSEQQNVATEIFTVAFDENKQQPPTDAK